METLITFCTLYQLNYVHDILYIMLFHLYYAKKGLNVFGKLDKHKYNPTCLNIETLSI